LSHGLPEVPVFAEHLHQQGSELVGSAVRARAQLWLEVGSLAIQPSTETMPGRGLLLDQQQQQHEQRSSCQQLHVGQQCTANWFAKLAYMQMGNAHGMRLGIMCAVR
jgi:hypothetical protein